MLFIFSGGSLHERNCKPGAWPGSCRKTDGPFRHPMHHVFAGLSPVQHRGPNFCGRGWGIWATAPPMWSSPVTVITLALPWPSVTAAPAFLLVPGPAGHGKCPPQWGNAVTLTVLVSLLLTAIFAVGGIAVWRLGATRGQPPHAVEYFTTCCLVFPLYVWHSHELRDPGGRFPAFAMLSTLVGCVMNVILDPIAIFALQMA